MAKLFGAVVDGEMIVGEMGKVVSQEWRRIPEFRRNVLVDQFVVMPNHFHGLVIIDNCANKELSGDNVDHAENSSRTLQANSLGAIVGQFKLAVSRQVKVRQLHPHKLIWQRNYHEHIVRNENSLNDIRKYIIENPARWHEDSLYVQ